MILYYCIMAGFGGLSFVAMVVLLNRMRQRRLYYRSNGINYELNMYTTLDAPSDAILVEDSLLRVIRWVHENKITLEVEELQRFMIESQQSKEVEEYQDIYE